MNGWAVFCQRSNSVCCVFTLTQACDADVVWDGCSESVSNRAPVAQLVEHRAVTREVVSSSPAGPTLRVFK